MSRVTENVQPTSSSEKCPQACTSACTNIAAKTEEHAESKQANAWLETKEGKDHLKICIPACPYKLLKARLDGEKAVVDKAREDHVKTCLPGRPCREGDEIVQGGETSAAVSGVSDTRMSIVQGISAIELASSEQESKNVKPVAEDGDGEGK